ncbi:hypothetical protein J6590_031364 [Homalodisca vitripennis]|nr:hypothetical protein J6590_031364 [Homalodisca vitripennis]
MLVHVFGNYLTKVKFLIHVQKPPPSLEVILQQLSCFFTSNTEYDVVIRKLILRSSRSVRVRPSQPSLAQSGSAALVIRPSAKIQRTLQPYVPPILSQAAAAPPRVILGSGSQAPRSVITTLQDPLLRLNNESNIAEDLLIVFARMDRYRAVLCGLP